VHTASSRQPALMPCVQVLKEQGREGLAEEAEAALQPGTSALEVARAARIAANQAHMASLGVGQAKRELSDAVAAGKPRHGGRPRGKRPVEEASRRSRRQEGVGIVPCIPR
jgi:hypothetical protein